LFYFLFFCLIDFLKMYFLDFSVLICLFNFLFFQQINLIKKIYLIYMEDKENNSSSSLIESEAKKSINDKLIKDDYHFDDKQEHEPLTTKVFLVKNFFSGVFKIKNKIDRNFIIK
jgi:hypothetical protein